MHTHKSSVKICVLAHSTIFVFELDYRSLPITQRVPPISHLPRISRKYIYFSENDIHFITLYLQIYSKATSLSSSSSTSTLDFSSSLNSSHISHTLNRLRAASLIKYSPTVIYQQPGS